MADKTVGAAISHLRGLREMSQQKLADRCGCARTTVARVESGQQDPSVGLLRRMLDALDADEKTRLSLVTS